MTLGKLVSADEYDAFTKRGRKARAFKAGQRARLKRKFWKRQRKDARAQISEAA